MSYEKSNVLRILLILGKEGAIDNNCSVTTTYIAEKLKVSQQTASRWLEDLHIDGYISKNQSGQSLKVRITKLGVKQLQLVYGDLQFIFNDVPKQIRGEISIGLGEGGYYISLPGYMDQFVDILGWKPFSGTLNLKLITEEDRLAFDLLSKSQFKLVNGFLHKETNRNLGKVFLYNCTIKYTSKETKGAIIIPDRTHHSDVMEILAKEHLRELWDLHEGDILIVNPKPLEV